MIKKLILNLAFFMDMQSEILFRGFNKEEYEKDKVCEQNAKDKRR